MDRDAFPATSIPFAFTMLNTELRGLTSGWPGRNATTTWITIMPASRAVAISSGTHAIASADCAAVMNVVRAPT
jgi:hypothetical protein